MVETCFSYVMPVFPLNCWLIVLRHHAAPVYRRRVSQMRFAHDASEGALSSCFYFALMRLYSDGVGKTFELCKTAIL